MKTPTPAILFASVLAVGLLACSGDAGDEAESGADAAVEITDSQFEPADLEVATGTSVTWTNNDDLPHTVSFEDSSIASSEELGEGDTFATTFEGSGSFPYVCTLHPEMTATVTVVD